MKPLFQLIRQEVTVDIDRCLVGGVACKLLYVRCGHSLPDQNAHKGMPQIVKPHGSYTVRLEYLPEMLCDPGIGVEWFPACTLVRRDPAESALRTYAGRSHLGPPIFGKAKNR